MSKFSNACCISIITTLSLASCSTLLTNRKTATETSEVITDNIAQTTDELSTFAELDNTEVQPIVDSLAIEEIWSSNIEISEGEAIEEDEIPRYFFEGAQTSAMVIDEYKNSVIDDIKIDLREWNSYYPADGYITSTYGWRKSRMHAGIDIKAYKGDNLYAAFDGVVRLAKYYSSFGNCVIIRHYNGLETLYAHATQLLVEVNDVVKAGDVIAYAGSTGRSTGSHLHFETRINGHYFNPDLILDTQNRKIKDANLYITMRNGKLFASNNDSEEEREAYILKEISIRYHIVKSGDVLSRIAANNGTTVATICRLNGIKSTSILRIGQRLIVRDGIKPPATTSTSSTATSTAAKTTTSAPAKTTSTSTTIDKSNAIEYRVKSGDVLSTIAQRHGTTVTAICRLNGISSRSTLQINQHLYIPNTGKVVPAARSSSSTTATTSTSGSTEPTYYYVKSGDTLSKIAKQYGTTVTALCDLNGISSTSTLSLKQRLRVK